MTTEQYQMGYEAGFNDGFDAGNGKGAQPVQQEPVEYQLEAECKKCGAKEIGVLKFKSAPVQAQEQRKPLTDEQCQAVIDSTPTYDAWGRTDKEGDVNLHEFARALEAAHNIKEQP